MKIMKDMKKWAVRKIVYHEEHEGVEGGNTTGKPFSP